MVRFDLLCKLWYKAIKSKQRSLTWMLISLYKLNWNNTIVFRDRKIPFHVFWFYGTWHTYASKTFINILNARCECCQECWKKPYFGIYTATAENFMFFWYEFIWYATCTKIPNKYHHAHTFPCHKVLLACFGFFALFLFFVVWTFPAEWKPPSLFYQVFFCVKMGWRCYHWHCAARPTHTAIYFYHFRCVLITIILIFLLVIFGVYIESACTPDPCVCIADSFIVSRQML